jgi:large subunit ribosomal protein L18
MLRRKMRTRKRIFGTAERPRLAVHRSLNQIYVQLIDDSSGVTLAAASSRDAQVASGSDKLNKSKRSVKVGERIAELAKQKGIEHVALDRSGFLYHGRIKAVAEGARKGGLKF